MTVAAAEHDHSLCFAVSFEHKRVGLAPLGLVGLGRASRIKLGFVVGESNQIGYGHIFANGVR